MDLSKSILPKVKKSVIGMLISIFILHGLLIVLSLDRGELTVLLSKKILGSELQLYIYQFLIACWTGAILPLCMPLIKEEVAHYYARIALNMFLSFTVYFSWLTFIFGYSSKANIGIHIVLFLIFIFTDYWVMYGLQFIALKRKVEELNIKIDNIEGSFLRDEGYDMIKRY
jgi:hypothetical protein